MMEQPHPTYQAPKGRPPRVARRRPNHMAGRHFSCASPALRITEGDPSSCGAAAENDLDGQCFAVQKPIECTALLDSQPKEQPMKKLLATLSSLSLIAVAAPAFAGTTETKEAPKVEAKTELKAKEIKAEVKDAAKVKEVKAEAKEVKETKEAPKK
jgi:hypothetical protein